MNTTVNNTSSTAGTAFAKTRPLTTPATPLDLGAIQTMGRDLVASMQTVRELLEARASALDACRAALEEHHNKMVADGKALGELESQTCGEIETRLAEVAKREAECAKKEKELSSAVKSADESTQRIYQEKSKLDDQEKDLVEREKALQALADELKADRQKFGEDRDRNEESSRKLKADLAKFQADRAHWESRHAEVSALEMKLTQLRKTLDDDMQKFQSDRETIAHEKKAMVAREQELSALATALEKRRADIERRESSAAEYERQWDEKLKELNTARDSLASLQRHLETELTRVTGQKDELLPKYGVSEPDVKGAPANKDVPSPADAEARASLERFQKLCRDAKRRAIGAG